MEKDNKCTQINLRRIFNIFDPKYYIMIIVLLVGGIVIAVFNHTKNKTSVSVLVLSIIIYITVIAVIEILIIIHKSPKKLNMSLTEVDFEYRVSMPPQYGISHGYFPLKVHCSVYDIKKIEFHQNRVEKIFNVGHISFSGKVFLDANRDVDRIKIKQPFYIYGITNFDQFKNEFKR